MKKIIVANWKMNPASLDEAKRLATAYKKAMAGARNIELIVCPPFPYLEVIKSLSGQVIKTGAQDCFWQAEGGAYTGETSPAMLKNIGCEYVIIGHSERRKYFEENDGLVNKKTKAALAAGLKPILCVGDQNRSASDDRNEIRQQLKIGLAGVKKNEAMKVSVVYEPIWAVSSQEGIVVSPEEVGNAKAFIKNVLTEIFDKATSQKIKILYGGSVDEKNINDFIAHADIDGFLVGQASLKAESFVKIISACV